MFKKKEREEEEDIYWEFKDFIKEEPQPEEDPYSLKPLTRCTINKSSTLNLSRKKKKRESVYELKTSRKYSTDQKQRFLEGIIINNIDCFENYFGYLQIEDILGDERYHLEMLNKILDKNQLPIHIGKYEKLFFQLMNIEKFDFLKLILEECQELVENDMVTLLGLVVMYRDYGSKQDNMTSILNKLILRNIDNFKCNLQNGETLFTNLIKLPTNKILQNFIKLLEEFPSLFDINQANESKETPLELACRAAMVPLAIYILSLDHLAASPQILEKCIQMVSKINEEEISDVAKLKLDLYKKTLEKNKRAKDLFLKRMTERTSLNISDKTI